MKVSLWMMPPEPIVSSLHHQITHIANTTGTHPYLPHVTVVMGLQLNETLSTEHIHGRSGRVEYQVLEDLRREFEGFGSIPCHFVTSSNKRDTSTGYCYENNECIERNPDIITSYIDDDDYEEHQNSHSNSPSIQLQIDTVPDQPKRRKIEWTQACIAIVERSKQFFNANRLASKIFCNYQSRLESNTTQHTHTHAHHACTDTTGEENDDDVPLPQPIGEPHLSFAYGIDERTCQKMVKNVPPNFESWELALYSTDPATVEGVEQWYEIGRFSLH